AERPVLPAHLVAAYLEVVPLGTPEFKRLQRRAQWTNRFWIKEVSRIVGDGNGRAPVGHFENLAGVQIDQPDDPFDRPAVGCDGIALVAGKDACQAWRIFLSRGDAGGDRPGLEVDLVR